MESKIIFIYDGQCPFCNQFAELLELKSNLQNIELQKARENPYRVPIGYDMDAKGAILFKDDEMLYGAQAINWICSQIKEPSGALLKILSVTFSSSKRTYFFFPFLLLFRRVLLFLKGVPRKFSS